VSASAAIESADLGRRLPLPEEAPLHFRMLPEYLVENVAEYYDFLARCVPLVQITVLRLLQLRTGCSRRCGQGLSDHLRDYILVAELRQQSFPESEARLGEHGHAIAVYDLTRPHRSLLMGSTLSATSEKEPSSIDSESIPYQHSI